jgi:hypothetical protein
MNGSRKVVCLCVGLASLLAVACGGGGNESAGDAGKAETAAPAASPLPDSAFKVEWGPTDVPATLHRGQSITASVTLKNASDQKWPDMVSWRPPAGPGSGASQTSTGPAAVRLSHRWWDSEMKDPVGDWVSRVELPHPLAPGESVTLPVVITAPSAPGSYRIQFDLVQELVAWFESKGAAKLVVPVAVT